MTDIVERLRRMAQDVMPGNLCDQAADEIERLRQQLAETKEELASCIEDLDREVRVGNDYMSQLAECEKDRETWRQKAIELGLELSEAVRFHERENMAEQLATVTAERDEKDRQVTSLYQKWEDCKKERDELRQVCRDAYEVWAGSEGIPEPETAAEAYLYQLLINMRDEVKRGLAKVGADKGEV